MGISPSLQFVTSYNYICSVYSSSSSACFLSIDRYSGVLLWTNVLAVWEALRVQDSPLGLSRGGWHLSRLAVWEALRVQDSPIGLSRGGWHSVALLVVGALFCLVWLGLVLFGPALFFLFLFFFFSFLFLFFLFSFYFLFFFFSGLSQ